MRASTKLVAQDGRGVARRPRSGGREPQAYPRCVSFVTALAAAVGLLVGVPVLIVALTATGPVGWVVAAIVFPIAALAVILRLGRAQPGDGEPPDRGA